MINKLPEPQYLTDSKGKKTFVVLRIEEYEELMEDFDLAVMAERKDDQKIDFEEFQKGLKRDGLI
jgi:predicted DNA-binding protein